MSEYCAKCGGLPEQHDLYAQAIGAKSIYVWSEGTDLPVMDCPKFELKQEARNGEE